MITVTEILWCSMGKLYRYGQVISGAEITYRWYEIGKLLAYHAEIMVITGTGWVMGECSVQVLLHYQSIL